jgi:hypothetical protein
LRRVPHWHDLFLRQDPLGLQVQPDEPSLIFFAKPTTARFRTHNKAIDILTGGESLAIAFDDHGDEVPRMSVYVVQGLDPQREPSTRSWAGIQDNHSISKAENFQAKEVLSFLSLYNANGTLYQIVDARLCDLNARTIFKYEKGINLQQGEPVKDSLHRPSWQKSGFENVELELHTAPARAGYAPGRQHPESIGALGDEMVDKGWMAHLDITTDLSEVFFVQSVAATMQHNHNSAKNQYLDTTRICDG